MAIVVKNPNKNNTFIPKMKKTQYSHIMKYYKNEFLLTEIWLNQNISKLFEANFFIPVQNFRRVSNNATVCAYYNFYGNAIFLIETKKEDTVERVWRLENNRWTVIKNKEIYDPYFGLSILDVEKIAKSIYASTFSDDNGNQNYNLVFYCIDGKFRSFYFDGNIWHKLCAIMLGQNFCVRMMREDETIGSEFHSFMPVTNNGKIIYIGREAISKGVIQNFFCKSGLEEMFKQKFGKEIPDISNITNELKFEFSKKHQLRYSIESLFSANHIKDT